MDSLCHSKFISFVVTPPSLVDPDTARHAEYTQRNVCRIEFNVGSGGQTEEEEQDADEHPEPWDLFVDAIRQEHRRIVS